MHDHLYSPAALTDKDGNVTISDVNYAARSSSLYGNPYLFTGRRVDILDSGSLKIQYNRNRYYDYYTGRWLTYDPLGIVPNPPKSNRFDVISQYGDGANLYEYVQANPIKTTDPMALAVCDILGGCTGSFDCDCVAIRNKGIGGHELISCGSDKWGLPKAQVVVAIQGESEGQEGMSHKI